MLSIDIAWNLPRSRIAKCIAFEFELTHSRHAKTERSFERTSIILSLISNVKCICHVKTYQMSTTHDGA